MKRQPEKVWVAANNSDVRHPVNNGWEGGGSRAKALLCRDKPIHVFVCTDEELTELRECYRCNAILRERAINEAMHAQLMRET